MNQLKVVNNETFEEIKHLDEFGNEFWLARELQEVLRYREWRNFEVVINKAKTSCSTSNYDISDHFVEVNKMVKTGDSNRQIKEYKLTRYACYLIVQNADPSKEVVALGQTYFAVQTRKQEMNEQEYSKLSETDKRFYNRKLTKSKNKMLNEAAKNAGVKNFDQFHNAGYQGLYNGETADDIAKRKNLRYREDILDNMGSSELIINLFRIDQTEQKIVNENIQGENKAIQTHFSVGQKVRDTIKELGGTMPEELPTPKQSLKELKRGKSRKEQVNEQHNMKKHNDNFINNNINIEL